MSDNEFNRETDPQTPPAVPPVSPPMYRGEPHVPAPAPPVPPAAPTSTPHSEPSYPPLHDTSEPLQVCDYTEESDEPCEEPAVQKRWSSAAVVTAASLGAVVGGLLVAAGLVWAFGLIPSSGILGTSTQNEPPAPQKISITPLKQNLDTARAVAKKAVPSVVNINIQQALTDPFGGSQTFRTVGNGSGVMIRPDGYILTNNHVVESADRVLVTVGVDDKVATVVGVDPSTDLAVLKIEGSGYPAAEVGSSKGLEVGQFVMAVGSPFGLEKTVTSGIISALQRSELVQDRNDLTTYTNLIQTDAAINPGNSGGALVDENGRLVGINTLIQSPAGDVGVAQSAGIGFAIPIDFAVDIANQLISSGKATHPYIGVSTETVDQGLAAQFGLPVQNGALVRFVSPGGPAETAGIKPGDIIVKIGGLSVTGVEDVFAAIREHRIGEPVPVEFVRGDQTMTESVTLGSDASRQ